MDTVSHDNKFHVEQIFQTVVNAYIAALHISYIISFHRSMITSCKGGTQENTLSEMENPRSMQQYIFQATHFERTNSRRAICNNIWRGWA